MIESLDWAWEQNMKRRADAGEWKAKLALDRYKNERFIFK
jgi:uncharacterized membrane-anchored protein